MGNKRFNNQTVKQYLNSLPQEEDFSKATAVITVSMKYFDKSQLAGQDFKDWTDKERLDLLNKLKEYTGNTKQFWLNQRCGAGGLKILAVYDSFPVNTDFKWPAFIPKDGIKWARFRLDQKIRIVGFFVNEKTAKIYSLSTDTFYLVFLDREHKFYKMEDA